MSSTDTSDIDGTLCCICYSQKNEVLVNATQQKFSTLEINLKEFIQLNALPYSIKLSRLDDGLGIAATLHSHGAVYHKSCRNSCNSYRVKHVRDSLDKQRQQADGISPKKLYVILHIFVLLKTLVFVSNIYTYMQNTLRSVS